MDGRERQTDRQTDRDRDRQTDRQTQTDRDSDRDRDRDRQTDRQTETERQADKQTLKMVTVCLQKLLLHRCDTFRPEKVGLLQVRMITGREKGRLFILTGWS